MTAGETAVWAAEYVRARAEGRPCAQCARMAANRVDELHALSLNPFMLGGLAPSQRERLDDVLGKEAK